MSTKWKGRIVLALLGLTLAYFVGREWGTNDRSIGTDLLTFVGIVLLCLVLTTVTEWAMQALHSKDDKS